MKCSLSLQHYLVCLTHLRVYIFIPWLLMNFSKTIFKCNYKHRKNSLSLQRCIQVPSLLISPIEWLFANNFKVFIEIKYSHLWLFKQTMNCCLINFNFLPFFLPWHCLISSVSWSTLNKWKCLTRKESNGRTSMCT